MGFIDLKFYRRTLLMLLLLLSSTAQALECDVAFRATRITTEDTWYGDVEKPEFKSGVVSGEGNTRKQCVRDALSTLIQEGWEIKYQEIESVY